MRQSRGLGRDAHRPQPGDRGADRGARAGRGRGDRRGGRAGEGGVLRLARRRARPTGRGCSGGWRRSSRRTPRSSRGSSRENVGKPISGARGEIGMVAQVFHFYAGAVDKHCGETIPGAGGEATTFREPLGVVGLIVPWNFPLEHRELEARPGARVREHRRPQARRADAALGAPARRARVSRRGSPKGVVNVARRQGLGRRAAADRASGRREDRLHRARPRSAGSSCRAPRGRSSASRSSSAASRRT